MATPVIEVEDLRFRYPDGVEALCGINFRLDAGETVALLGANGSGKTSFLLHLVGLLRGEGRVRICGQDLTPETAEFARRKIGVLFQDSDDQLFMPSVEEDVRFGPLNQGLPPDEINRRIAEALERTEVADLADRAPHHLSAGQKRRVALAGVLAMEPEIILLDEPATFLDPPSRNHLIETLASLDQAKILVTHDVDLARALAARAVFFEQGRVLGDGPLTEIVERFNWASSDKRPALSS